MSNHLSGIRRGAAALTIGAVLSGCAHGDAAVDRTPIETHVVCLMAGNGCAPPGLLDAFDGWQKQNVLHRSNSAFRVTVVDEPRVETRLAFARCVPPSWGGGVVRRKSEFLNEAHAALAVPMRDGTSPNAGDCGDPGGKVDYDVRILGDGIDSQVRARLADNVRAQSATPLHVGVVCDSSDRGFATPACSGESLMLAYDAWLRDGASAGSTFRVFAVRDPRSAPSEELEVVAAADADPGTRAARLLVRRQALAALATRLQEGRTYSAIAESIHATIERLRPLSGRHAVVVLSDLRQRAGALDFERTVPTLTEFRATLEARGLELQASDMPIVGCGLHDQGGRDRGLDVRLGNAVAALWQDLLQPKAARVTLQKNCSLSSVTLL